LEALGLNLGYLLVQIFNFLIVLVVLRAWAYEPIMRMLDRRRQTIAQGLEDARIAAEARANAEQEAQKILADAQAAANQKVREATERAEAAGKELLAQAEADAARVREAAVQDAEQERERVLGDLRGQVGALAMAAARRLIGDALDEQGSHRLIEEFFSGVRSGQVPLLAGVDLKGEAAEVTSALPLTDSEKDVVRRDILSRMGDQTSITFRVDPAILGGLIIRVGDRVIDGSVAGQLENMRQSLV
jgi:F-type H+-transporting ATPase subunit b